MRSPFLRLMICPLGVLIFVCPLYAQPVLSVGTRLFAQDLPPNQTPAGLQLLIGDEHANPTLRCGVHC